MLYALEIPVDPVDSGKVLGDTLFASVASAYDALPDSLKQRVAGLKALNSLEHTFDRTRKDADIRTEQIESKDIKRTQVSAEQKKLTEAVHPVTGRKSIYVNDSTTQKIVGVSQSESDELLGELRSRCIRQDFVYRHKWRLGDLVMWDNCSSQHQAVADYALPLRRRMHRTTITGTVPF